MPYTKKSDALSQKVVDSFEDIAREKRFTNIGDTNHADPSIYETIAASMEQFARAGVKHIFLEFPGEHQSDIDRMLYDHGTNHEVLYRYFLEHHPFPGMQAIEDQHRHPEALANIAIKAREHGIKMHFADRPGDLPQIVSEHPEMVQHWMKAQKEGPSQAVEYLSVNLTSDEKKEFLTFMEKWVKARNAINSELADFINEESKDNRGQPEKAVITYGYGHSFGVKDLDEFLGVDQTATVAIYPSKKFHNTPIGLKIQDGNIDNHHKFYVQGISSGTHINDIDSINKEEIGVLPVPSFPEKIEIKSPTYNCQRT